MEATLFNLELHVDGVKLSDDVRTRINRRVDKWHKGHKDITGASIAVRQLSGSKTAHAFSARVVIYHRPENIAAVSKSEQPGDAILVAMEAAERQLRENRRVLRERRRRASNGDTTPKEDSDEEM